MSRLRKYLELKGWWNETLEAEAVAAEKAAVLAALAAVCVSVCVYCVRVCHSLADDACASQAGAKPKPPPIELASDVLDVIPKHLKVIHVSSLSTLACVSFGVPVCTLGSNQGGGGPHRKVPRTVRFEQRTLTTIERHYTIC